MPPSLTSMNRHGRRQDIEDSAHFGYRDFLAATLEARGRFEEIILTEQFERTFPREDSTMNEYDLSRLLTCVGTPGRAAELFPEADWDYDERGKGEKVVVLCA